MTIPSVTGFDINTLLLSVVSTGALGKVFLIAVRTMPPPPADCNFACRWVFDFLQSLGDNADKLGSVRPNRTSSQATLVTDKQVHTEETTSK